MAASTTVLTGLSQPISTVAQASFVVQGRIVDPAGFGVQYAVVELDGHDPVLTSSIGAFRFEGVGAGDYVLRVRALGFAPISRSIVVAEDVRLTLSLERVAIELDPVVVVAPKDIDLAGRVRDPSRDVHIMGADILTSQGEQDVTDAHGQFKVEALEGVPVMVAIRGFGYMPLDTVVVPTEDGEYSFSLAVDPLVERMIDVEIGRLEQRAGGLRAVTMRPMNRDELLRWLGFPLSEVLVTRYPRRIQRINCVIVDERAVNPTMIMPVLESMLVQEVERVEFLFRGAMLRVYTREFMRHMIGGGIELRSPTYVDLADPPFCG